MASSRADTSLTFRVGLIAAFAGALIWRAPLLFTSPRFWAEEGSRYFAFALAAHERGQWWAGLLNRPATVAVGYFALWPNLATTAAAAAPIVYAPLVTTLAAASVQLWVAAYWLWARHDLWPSRWQKVLGLAILLLAPLSAEVWLNTINSQFFLLVLTVLVLFARTDSGAALRWASRVALFVAGLTGGVSCVLVPWFVERAWAERTRERTVQALILIGCLLIQVGVAVTALMSPQSLAGERSSLQPLSTIVAVGMTQSLGLVLGGITWMRALAAGVVERGGLGSATSAWLAIQVLVLAFVSWGIAGRDRIRLLSIYVALVVTVITTSLGADKLALVPPGVGERYFLAANTVLMLTILAAAGFPGSSRIGRLRSMAMGFLVAWALAQGAARFAEQPFVRADWPRWRDEVVLWRADPSHVPGIWPAGWTLSGSPR